MLIMASLGVLLPALAVLVFSTWITNTANLYSATLTLATPGAAGSLANAKAIVIDTDPVPGTGAGGTWWDVAVPEVSDRAEVMKAREGYVQATKRQWLVN